MQYDAEQEWIQKYFPPDKEPRFPYNGYRLRTPGWLSVTHRAVHTYGFDPYAGDEWTLEVKFRRKSLLVLVVSSLISFQSKLSIGPHGAELNDYAGELKELPWYARRFWELCEYRELWYQYNVFGDIVDDGYPSIESVR